MPDLSSAFRINGLAMIGNAATRVVVDRKFRRVAVGLGKVFTFVGWNCRLELSAGIVGWNRRLELSGGLGAVAMILKHLRALKPLVWL